MYCPHCHAGGSLSVACCLRAFIQVQRDRIVPGLQCGGDTAWHIGRLEERSNLKTANTSCCLCAYGLVAARTMTLSSPLPRAIHSVLSSTFLYLLCPWSAWAAMTWLDFGPKGASTATTSGDVVYRPEGIWMRICNHTSCTRMCRCILVVADVQGPNLCVMGDTP